MKVHLALKTPEPMSAVLLLPCEQMAKEVGTQVVQDAAVVTGCQLAEWPTSARLLREWRQAACIGLAYRQRFPGAWRLSTQSTRITKRMCAREEEFFVQASRVVPLVALTNYWLGDDMRPDDYIYSLQHMCDWTEPALFERTPAALLALELLAVPDGPYVSRLVEYLAELLPRREFTVTSGMWLDCEWLRARCLCKGRLQRYQHDQRWVRLADALAVIAYETGNRFLDPPQENEAPIGAVVRGRGLSAATLRELEAEWRRAQRMLDHLQLTVSWLEAEPQHWPQVVELVSSCYAPYAEAGYKTSDAYGDEGAR